jgi:hypothetical protein
MPNGTEAFLQLIHSRLDALSAIVSRAGFDEVVTALTLMRDYETTMNGSLTGQHGDHPRFSDDIDRDLDKLTEILRDGEHLDLLRWSSEEMTKMLDSLRAYDGTFPDDGSDTKTVQLANEITALENRLRSLNTHIESVRWQGELVQSAERTKEYEAEAKSAAETAQESAGTTGNVALSHFFDEYAEEERKAAFGFRVATLATIGVAVAVAVVVWLPLWAKTGTEWYDVVAHLAVVLGIGAFSAYLGRQAGQHRRVFNWAKGVAIQLRSFPAFIQPVSNPDTSAQIYLLFASRVLGAMPERTSRGGNTDGVGVTDLVGLVSALTKAQTP